MFRNLLGRWTGDNRKVKGAVQWVEKNLGSEFTPILVDPGVISRFREFTAFVAKTQSHFKNVVELRKAFSKSLGYREGYRAIALTPAELNEVKKNGIASKLWTLNSAQRESQLSDFLEEHPQGRKVGTGDFSDIKTRVSPGIHDFTSISTSWTMYPDVAISATYHSAEMSGRQVYLFKVRSPEIDFISYNPLSLKENSAEQVIKVGEKNYSTRDPNLEFFRFNHTNRVEILEVTAHPEVPPPFLTMDPPKK